MAGRRVRDSLLRSRVTLGTASRVALQSMVSDSSGGEVQTGSCLPCDAGVGTEFWLLLVSSRPYCQEVRFLHVQGDFRASWRISST